MKKQETEMSKKKTIRIVVTVVFLVVAIVGIILYTSDDNNVSNDANETSSSSVENKEESTLESTTLSNNQKNTNGNKKTIIETTKAQETSTENRRNSSNESRKIKVRILLPRIVEDKSVVNETLVIYINGNEVDRLENVSMSGGIEYYETEKEYKGDVDVMVGILGTDTTGRKDVKSTESSVEINIHSYHNRNGGNKNG